MSIQASILTALGRTEESRVAWQRVLEVDPTNTEAQQALANLGSVMDWTGPNGEGLDENGNPIVAPPSSPAQPVHQERDDERPPAYRHRS